MIFIKLNYDFIIKMQEDNKECRPRTQSIDILSCTQETIHLYNEFMSETYESKINQLQDDLARFFDALIWAQQKNPLLVYQMFQMKALNQIIQKYVQLHPIILLRNSILLLSNCQKSGLVAEQLIQHAYPHMLIIKILSPKILDKYKQQIEQYFGNFLKCYHRLFKIQWLNKFILEGQYFELMQINLRFFNCRQLITRTSALNIVLDLLNYEKVRHFVANCQIRSSFYKCVFDRMTKLFRNQLAQFGLRIAHISKHDNVELILRELEDKISLWQDISNNSQGMQNLLHLQFSLNVLFPLALGPIKQTQVPLFSLKFSLFVIKNLIPILKNIGILQIFIRMIFRQQKILYYPSSLCKAIIEPFRLQKLMDKQFYQQEDQQKQQFVPSVKEFYQTLLKSKDNHFILMTNALLSTIFQQVRSDEHLLKQYGFHYGGKSYMKIGQILLQQLQNPHQLNVIQSILNTLIMIGNGKSLQTELHNRYIYIFQHLIQQKKTGIKSSNTFLGYLVQTIQYDIGIIDKFQFAKQLNNEKYMSMFKVVFTWELKKEEQHRISFYSRVPDSPAEYFRYILIKFMLLRKARAILLEGYGEDSILQQYYSTIVVHSPFIAGDIYGINQFQSVKVPCEIFKQKSYTPALFIRDDDFFVLAQPAGSKQNHIQIIEGCKIKHVVIQQAPKKKMIKVDIRQFDQKQSEIKVKQILYLKANQEMEESIKNSRKISLNKHIAFIKDCLQNTKTNLPSPSLI